MWRVRGGWTCRKPRPAAPRASASQAARWRRHDLSAASSEAACWSLHCSVTRTCCTPCVDLEGIFLVLEIRHAKKSLSAHRSRSAANAHAVRAPARACGEWQQTEEPPRGSGAVRQRAGAARRGEAREPLSQRRTGRRRRAGARARVAVRAPDPRGRQTADARGADAGKHASQATWAKWENDGGRLPQRRDPNPPG